MSKSPHPYVHKGLNAIQYGKSRLLSGLSVCKRAKKEPPKSGGGAMRREKRGILRFQYSMEEEKKQQKKTARKDLAEAGET